MKSWPIELINKGNTILEKIDFCNSLPEKENVLRFFANDFQNIKVVIIGQDPYPTPGVANGIAFATNLDTPIPQSLRNIFKEINEIQGFVKTDQTLSSWEKQGVLLLNRSLTTKPFQSNAHKVLWDKFTIEIISYIDSQLENVYFVLWGNDAIALRKYIINNEKNVITDAHPSPLSVRKRDKKTFKILLDKTDIVW